MIYEKYIKSIYEKYIKMINEKYIKSIYEKYIKIIYEKFINFFFKFLCFIKKINWSNVNLQSLEFFLFSAKVF